MAEIISSSELFAKKNIVASSELFGKKKGLWDRYVESTAKESEMMGSPANLETLRTVVAGGAAWIPAGIIKSAGIVSGQREDADELANVVQEKIVGTPSTDVGKFTQQQISAPFEKLSEKSQEYADIVYDKTGSPILATATRVAGEAIPFVLPYVGHKAVKGAKTSLTKDIKGLDTMKFEEGKPTSITPETPRSERVSPEFTKNVLTEKEQPLKIEQKKDFVFADKDSELIERQAAMFEEARTGKKIVKTKELPKETKTEAKQSKEDIAPAEKVEPTPISQAEKVAKPIETPEMPAEGKPAVELDLSDFKTTGIKNEIVDFERQKRGWEKLERHGVTNTDQINSFNKAKELVDKGERNPKELADTIVRNKEYQVSELDSFVLEYERARLNKSYENTIAKIEEAQKKGDTVAEHTLINEMLKTEQELMLNDRASGVAGTQWSNIGKARQRIIAEDYSLANIIRKATTDKGSELTYAERAKYTNFAKQIAEANEKIKAYESKIAQLESQKTIKRIKQDVDFELRSTKRAYTKKELDIEFTSLSTELSKTLSGLHANPLANPEAIALVGKMARNRVQSGYLTVEGLVDSIYTTIKSTGLEVSKRDIRDAISKYGVDSKPITKTEATTQLTELKKQMRLMSKMEDMKAGEFVAKEKRTIPDSAEVADLKRQIKELSPKATPEEIALKTYKTRTQNRIKELESRIERGDFEPKQRKETALDKDALKLYHELDRIKHKYNEARLADQYRRMGKLEKSKEILYETANLMRSLKASMDVSAVFRQGLFFSVSHPIKSAKSIPAMLKAFKNDRYRFAVEQEIINRPTYKLAKESNLELTDIGNNLTRMEETFMSRLAEKIPGVAGSQRAYTTFLNKTRMDVFDHLTQKLAKSEGKILPEEARAIALLINEATGRGSLGSKANTFTGLNTVFFAPRLVASRFQLLAGHSMWRGTKASRKIIAKEYGRFLAGIATIYAIAEMAGFDIEYNPLSSEFGKIRIGDTRFDPLGGLAQAITFSSRIAKGEIKDTQSGIFTSIRGDVPYGKSDVWDVMARFTRTKFSPAVGVLIDYLAGQDVVGQPVGLVDLPEKAFMPMAWKDIYEAMVSEGVPTGLAAGVLAMLGVGVMTYTKNNLENSKAEGVLDYRERVGEAKFEQANIRYNKLVNAEIDRVVKTPRYKGMNSEEQQKVIDKIKEKHKRKILGG